MGGKEDKEWGSWEREILEKGLTAEALHLAALSEMPNWSATPNDLAAHMRTERGEVRRILNRLVRTEIVRKERGDNYAIDRKRWPEAEDDLRRLRAIREEAPERKPSRRGPALGLWLFPVPMLSGTHCGCEALDALALACCGLC